MNHWEWKASEEAGMTEKWSLKSDWDGKILMKMPEKILPQAVQAVRVYGRNDAEGVSFVVENHTCPYCGKEIDESENVDVILSLDVAHQEKSLMEATDSDCRLAHSRRCEENRVMDLKWEQCRYVDFLKKRYDSLEQRLESLEAKRGMALDCDEQEKWKTEIGETVQARDKVRFVLGKAFE